jgi:hypothetical protein
MKKNIEKHPNNTKKSNKKRNIVKRIEGGFIVITEEGATGSSSSIRRAKLAAKGMDVYNLNIMRHVANEREEMINAISINKKKKATLESKYKDIEIPA